MSQNERYSQQKNLKVKSKELSQNHYIAQMTRTNSTPTGVI